VTLGLDWTSGLPDRGYWALTLYPEAGEAGGCIRSVRRERPDGPVGPVDPERSQAEAARRARGQIRRYCAANRLNRLGTLTYAGGGCHDPSVLRADVAAFFKGLRAGLGGKRLPYLWVPEWHPGGHGLHVHFAVGRFIKRGLIEEAWGRGHVHIKLLGDLPVGSGSLEESRVSGRYLAKYAAKALDEQRLPGLHRYEVAQSFQPGKIECYGPTTEHAIENAARYMGREPAVVWRSSSVEGWCAPPACWVAWND
jgi:hypothetical protein